MTDWPCRHRGTELRRERCISRGQDGEAVVYTCAEPTVNGECTLAATSLGLRDCFGCDLRSFDGDKPPAPAAVLPETLPCIHRGDLLRTDKCDLCGIRGLPFDVFGCAVHVECSISRRHSKIKACVGCEQRQETAPAAPIVVARPPKNPNMLLDRKGRPITGLENKLAGAHAFLICGGPSLREMDLSLLNQRGILTAAVNNAATVHRPHIWITVDVPRHFAPQLWSDPAIIKFAPLEHTRSRLSKRNGDGWAESGQRTCDMPNVFHFRLTKGINPQTLLTSKYPTMGAKKKGVHACVMFASLRILFWLGVRTLYLLGAEFRMEKPRPYAFAEKYSADTCAYNNRKFEIVNQTLTEAAPHFAEYGFNVWNCTPDSALNAFPRLDYQDAVRQALEAAEMTGSLVTRGLYAT